MYRDKDNKTIISFKTKDTVICGARPEHLRDREFVLSELNNNILTTHWDEIYTTIKK